MRCVAIDGIRTIERLERPAKEVAHATFCTVLGPGYGIFAGNALQ